MHRVAGDDMACHVEFFQQLLDGGDFVGLLVDLEMRKDQRSIGGQGAENLFCLDVVEAIETSPEHLASRPEGFHTERLAEAGIEPSVGSVGDSYDNALAETINGLYKADVYKF